MKASRAGRDGGAAAHIASALDGGVKYGSNEWIVEQRVGVRRAGMLPADGTRHAVNLGGVLLSLTLLPLTFPL